MIFPFGSFCTGAADVEATVVVACLFVGAVVVPGGLDMVADALGFNVDIAMDGNICWRKKSEVNMRSQGGGRL